MSDPSCRPRRLLSLLALIAALSLPGPALSQGAKGSVKIPIPGLKNRVKVTTDEHGVPHIVAHNDADLARAQGFVHARDRFFQMDMTRREVSGDRAEVLGTTVNRPNDILDSDIQNRTIGLRRAAARSAELLSEPERVILQAYADGVNAYLASTPLPPEYARLELTQARPWDIVDALAIAKAIAASLSLDIDSGLEERLAACVNLVPGLRSLYRWKDALCDEPETLLVIKAHVNQVEALTRRLAWY